MNTDVNLLSNDGYLFPISSQTLARTSGWFRTMFTIPQNSDSSGSPQSSTEHIPMSESSDILAALLSIVSGISLPQMNDIDFVESLLFAAEKYDMSFPIAIIRQLALPSFLESHPIRVYGIACRMYWKEEAQKAAAATLTSNIFSPESLLDLRHVETPHVVNLLSLHEKRRLGVLRGLDDENAFDANSINLKCSSCGEPSSCASWFAFKLAWTREPWRFLRLVLYEIEGRPSNMPELDALLETKCRCGVATFKESYTMQNLRIVARSLPDTIEVGLSLSSSCVPLVFTSRPS